MREDILRLLESFDIISFLEEAGIEYKTAGKNVSRGWVEINCLWCDDPSYHLGINLTSKMMNCWRCGSKGSIIQLIKKLYPQKSFPEVLRVLKIHSQGLPHTQEEKFNLAENSWEKWDKIIFSPPTKFHRDFLRRRGFTVKYTVERWKARFTSVEAGRWRWRVMIPILVRGKVLAWTSRKVREEIPGAKWLFSSPPETLNPKMFLYNEDSIQPDQLLVVVEGVFDLWKLDFNGVNLPMVALLGSKASEDQLFKLWMSKPSLILLILDGDEGGRKGAEQITKELGGLIDICSVDLPDGKDPASLNEQEFGELVDFINKIKQEVKV